MSGEILNIDFHCSQMLVKALNKTKTCKEAAKLLGITERTVYRMKARYNIIYDPRCGYYQYQQLKFIVL